MSNEQFLLVGFWERLVAWLIDSTLIYLLTRGISFTGLGGIFIHVILPVIITIGCWLVWQATPGKMAISAVIVDADSGQKPTAGQMVGRFIGYLVSALAFGFGFLWVGLDKKKQGWHDKLATTLVIKRREAPVTNDTWAK